MKTFLEKVKHPEYFQGLRDDHYFEGWYFKFQNARSEIIAVILGVSKTKGNEFAFIQVINNHDSKTSYTKYDIGEFSYEEDPWSVRIADNYFSFDKVMLNIAADGIELSGEVNLSEITPLKTSLYAPNIMGPFAYLNFMECYHGVLSLHHNLQGQLTLNGRQVNFDGGCGYIEKDWGTSFPKEYVWVHGQDCANQDTLFFSLAHIPFLGSAFNGLISVLYIDGIQYRFSSYDFAKVESVSKAGDSYFLAVKQGGYRLTLDLLLNNAKPLFSPQQGKMVGTIKESQESVCRVRLTKGAQTIMQREFDPCLMEVEWHSFD
jgi:hypothetical protein